jgi:hypothetical protein
MGFTATSVSAGLAPIPKRVARRYAWRKSGRIDAELSPDVGELHEICETAIGHHRAEFNQPRIGEEEPWRARSGKPAVQQTARRLAAASAVPPADGRARSLSWKPSATVG